MDTACQVIAELMLKLDIWRERWRIETDGCVFKVDIKGYPKHGTERYRKQQEYAKELLKEFPEEQQ